MFTNMLTVRNLKMVYSIYHICLVNSQEFKELLLKETIYF
jgi:hypothetical protein